MEYLRKKEIDEDYAYRQEIRRRTSQSIADRRRAVSEQIKAKKLADEKAEDRRQQLEDLKQKLEHDEKTYQQHRAEQKKDREEEKYGKTVNAVHTSQYNARGTGEYANTVTDKLNQGKEIFFTKHPKAQTAKNVVSGYSKASTTTAIYDRNKANQIKQSDSLFATLQPTIVEVGITNYTGGNVWSDTLTLGVKAMVRLVPTGQMVANMCDAAQDRAIFKAIKFTKGEINALDILFGKNKYKNLGIENGKGKWLSALKKRRMIDNISSVLGIGRLTPTTSIIITENEALEIKNLTGIDFHDKSNINRLFKKYFLLGFGIYDTDTKILHAMFDGDNDFTQVPFRAMVAGIKKETDLLANPQKRF